MTLYEFALLQVHKGVSGAIDSQRRRKKGKTLRQISAAPITKRLSGSNPQGLAFNTSPNLSKRKCVNCA